MAANIPSFDVRGREVRVYPRVELDVGLVIFPFEDVVIELDPIAKAVASS